MSNEMFKYYTGIQVSITGPELKSISQNRYDIIEQQAYEDVQNGRKARAESLFKSNAEYKSYLLNLVDFAQKLQNGVKVVIGSE